MPVNSRYGSTVVRGWVAPGFEPVRAEFARNFSRRGELGAACAVYHRGRPVVDLWGGFREEQGRLPWAEDTLMIVASTTKGLAAMAVALAHSREWLDYDERVATYWPAFAQAGKGGVTVRQLLSHQAGLAVLEPPLAFAQAADLDQVAEAIARQKPAWQPGTRYGYHAVTLGWYLGEFIRQVDPQHRSLGRFFHEEIAVPLGLEFYIGLPREIPDSRLATVRVFGLGEILRNVSRMPLSTALGFLNPRSLTARAFRTPFPESGDEAQRQRAYLSVEGPGYNGVGEARSIAKAYSVFATGGRELGIRPETIEALHAPATPPSGGSVDLVIRVPTAFSLGFAKPFPAFRFGGPQAFGMLGTGGSLGFGDPDTEIGFAYSPSRWCFRLFDDPRQVALRRAVERCTRGL